MSRKIHMTESQINEIKKRLKEAEFAAQGNGTETTQSAVRNFAQNNTGRIKPGDTVSVDSETVSDGKNLGKNTRIVTQMEEGKFTTKRQIKEAKLKKLKENCVRYTKSDIEKQF